MQLQLRSPDNLPIEQLHMLVAEGYCQSYNIGILERMLATSKIDDDLEAANGGGTFLPVLRTHSVSTGQIKGKMDEAATGLLKSYRILATQLVGMNVEFMPEPADDPAKSAWIVPRGAESLVPDERVPFQSDDDLVIGTVGALSLNDAVIVIFPQKNSTISKEGNMVCVKAAGFAGKQVSAWGKIQALTPQRNFVKISKKEKAQIAKNGERLMFTKLPSGLYFRVLLPNSLENVRG